MSEAEVVEVEADPTANGHATPASDANPAAAPAASCTVCAAPIEAHRAAIGAKTCGSVECQAEARRRRQRVDHRRAARTAAAGGPASPGVTNGAGPAPAAEQRFDAADGRPGASAGISPGRRHDLASTPDPLRASDDRTDAGLIDVGAGLASQPPGNDLGAIYRALTLAGARVVRVDLIAGGETWTVTRHNGGPT